MFFIIETPLNPDAAPSIDLNGYRTKQSPAATFQSSGPESPSIPFQMDTRACRFPYRKERKCVCMSTPKAPA